MKRVLLIGDSIRMGYQEKVKELLKDEYEVVFWNDNSRFIQYLYWQLNQMFLLEGPFDIVHFNSGYWDMNIEPPMEEALNPIPEYLFGLQKVINYIKSQNALPIFANTCPIYSDGSGLDNTGTKASITYKNEWVVAYNTAAEKLMKENIVQINDLYSVLLGLEHYGKCSDLLHLTDEGYAKCAEAIASIIREKV